MSGWVSSTGWNINLASPGPIGSTTPSSGAFTTLSASSTVSGIGFNNYLASPPAIGGTTAASGKFTTLTATQNVVIATLGKGVDFSGVTPAVGMTSQLLDDYEEGSFTPTVIGSTTAGTASYNRQTGRYTKIGRLVTFSIDLDWSAGTGAGDMQFSGLPFTSQAGVNTGIGCSFVGLPLTLSYVAQPWIGGGSSTILAYQSPIGGTVGGITSVAYASSGSIMLFGSYVT